MLNPPLKKLYACLNKESQQTFFASMVDQKGTMAEMRSSYAVNQGDVILLKPVEEGWNGKPFAPNEITGSTQTLEGNVTRAEGRGVFFVRVLSFAEKDIANQVRTGQISKDNLKIESSAAGLVVTIRMQGRLAMESATRLKPFLTTPDQNLLLIDCTGLSYVAKNSVNMLYLTLKEAWESGKHISMLVNPESSVEEMLRDSKIREIVDIQYNRDEAVAGLISQNFT